MPPDGNDCGEQAIVQELERASASTALANSPQLKAMLRYLVTEALAGRSAKIKAYNIAVDVFGRSASFDPATDTIVRVQAGRLRAALTEHYRSAPEVGLVRIELPKGSYAPVFVRNDVAASPTVTEQAEERIPGLLQAPEVVRDLAKWCREQLQALDWRSPQVIAAALAVVIATAFLIANLTAFRSPAGTNAGIPSSVQPPVDTLVLAPIHNLSDVSADQSFAKALSSELATALTRTGLIKMRLLNGDLDVAGEELREAARSHDVRWGLTGVLHRSDEHRRTNIYLVDLTNGEVIWSQDYTMTTASQPERLVDSLVLDLVPQLYKAAKHALEGKLNPSPLELFVLATWFPGAEVNSLSWQLDRVALARRAISAAPSSGQAYSVLADKLTLLANLDPAFDTQATWKEAADAARDARVLAPHSADVAFNLALYHLHAGELGNALLAVRRTLELAPRHTLARFWRLVVPYTCTAPPQDVIDELVRYDTALSPSNPARWQTQAWLARLQLNSGRLREAKEAAQRSIQILPNLGAAIILIAANVEMGDAVSARKVFEEQRKYWKTFSFDHYNQKALTRVCSGSPLLDTLLRLHGAAASAVN